MYQDLDKSEKEERLKSQSATETIADNYRDYESRMENQYFYEKLLHKLFACCCYPVACCCYLLFGNGIVFAVIGVAANHAAGDS